MQSNPTILLSKPQAAVYYARTPLILNLAGQGGGKTELIGIISAQSIMKFPRIKGFIAANTFDQLSQATINKTTDAWEKYFGWTEYDKKENPNGFYVIDKKPPAHFKRNTRLKRYNNTISFANGALVLTGSLDNYKAHDGKEFGWAHLDEVKDAKEEALTTVILGRLRQVGLYYDPQNNNELVYVYNKDEAKAKGLVAFNPCYVHTSPSYGGIDWLLKMFKLENKEQEIRETLSNPYKFYQSITELATVVIYQTNWNEDNLPLGHIKKELARFTNDEADLFIRAIPFVKTGNEFYNEFKRSVHVVDKIKPNFNARFHVTYDFNVMPYVTQIVAQTDKVIKYLNKHTGEKYDYLEDWHPRGLFETIEVTRIKILKEFCLEPPQNETEQAADLLGQWLVANGAKKENCDLVVYGDASGHNRITGLGSLTQYKIIQRVLAKYFPTEIAAKRANVGLLIRRKFFNKLFAGKFDMLEIYIDASCTQTIRDFQTVKQDANGKLKEKKKGADGIMYEIIGHTSDAVDCFVCEAFKPFLKYID